MVRALTFHPLDLFIFSARLIDRTPGYFEPSSFPEGEVRDVLERFWHARKQGSWKVQKTENGV